MPKVIRNNAVVDDNWQIIPADAGLDNDALTALEQAIVPLSLWTENRQLLADKVTAGAVGVWLDSDEAPEALQDACKQFAIIAINFPVFSDGRGYSYARTLREHFGYKGELRAIGDVLRDQVYFYKRCGFDSFAIREDTDANAALEGLEDFSLNYQAACDNPAPLFKR